MEKRRELVRLDAGHPVFKSHFPGLPRVPGSLAAQGFLDLLARDGASGLRLERFRFRQFMAPGDYIYEIEPRGGESAVCRVWAGDVLFCEGVVSWQPES